MTSKLQNALIILGILAIGGIGYYLYTQNGDISLKNSAVNNQAAAETASFLQRLNELKTMELEGLILNDPRFTSLVDSSEIVIPAPVGRTNPFAANN